MMNIKISRIDTSLPLPQYETAGSFAFDLLARESACIQPKSLQLIPSNVIIECPPHLALQILPRSSTFRKKGLIFPHSIGLIDADYCGPNDEILIQVFNLSDTAITISRGEKIAQGLFIETKQVTFQEVERQSITKVSRGGFGSTDNK